MAQKYLDINGLTRYHEGLISYMSEAVGTQADLSITDPTNMAYINNVPDWVRSESKPEYSAEEVGADVNGAAAKALTEAKSYTDVSSASTLADAKNYMGENYLPVDATAVNAQKVNGLTVEAAVPANAKFTDTIYDDTDIKTQLNEKVPNTLTVNSKALSGNITLTANDVGADESGSAAKALSDAKEYNDTAYANANAYTDQKISELINGAPTTLDTLKEIADAMAENVDVVEALNEAIGTKANQNELDTHTGNNTIHITANERTAWNAKANSADLANYLPKTGGELANSKAGILTMHRTNGINVWAGYKGNNAILGYLGFSGVENPVYTSADGTKINPLLHSGNIADYAIPKTGGAVDGNLSIESTTAEALTYNLKNSLREGRFLVHTDGRLGFYDVTNSKWIITSATDGTNTFNGSAASAVKLDTTTAGSATQPVYFSGGKPVATTYTLGASVPSGAKFTDTTYSASTGLSLSGTAFSVKYGTAAGTACQGNDSRLSNSRPASDVYAWAKAASKPTYTASEVGALSTSGGAVNGRIGSLRGTYNATVSNRFGSSALEIRENDLVTNTKTDIAYAPSIGFHWGSIAAATFVMDNSAQFNFFKQDGSYANILCGSVFIAANTSYTTNQARNGVFVTTDPGAGASTPYVNGSVIYVYE